MYWALSDGMPTYAEEDTCMSYEEQDTCMYLALSDGIAPHPPHVTTHHTTHYTEHHTTHVTTHLNDSGNIGVVQAAGTDVGGKHHQQVSIV